MKCPNCDFIERNEAFGNPATCPKCGAIYEKALRIKQLRERQTQESSEAPASSNKFLKGLKGAAAGAAEARASRNAADGQTLYTKDGTPVVIRTENKPGCLRPILVLVAIICAVPLVTQCASSYQGYADRSSNSQPASTQAAEQPAAQKPAQASSRDTELRNIKIQRLAREGIKTKLHDPDTAKFRNQVGGCGEVNAKNLFGGYIGYKRFMYGGPDVIFLDGDPALEAGAFDSAWGRLCGPGGKLTFPD